jgi:hypothetical protein
MTPRLTHDTRDVKPARRAGSSARWSSSLRWPDKEKCAPCSSGDQRLAEARCGLGGVDPLSQPVSEHGVQTARRSASSAIDADKKRSRFQGPLEVAGAGFGHVSPTASRTVSRMFHDCNRVTLRSSARLRARRECRRAHSLWTYMRGANDHDAPPRATADTLPSSDEAQLR